MRRLHSTAVPGKEIKIKGSATIPYVELLNAKLFTLTTAITTGVTTDSPAAVVGDFAVTTHATGRGKIFASDGTNWVITGDGGVGFSQGAAVADPAALTAATLTDNSAGTANTTVQALADGTVYANDVAAIRNNFADLVAMVNKLTVDVGVLRTKQIAIITSLEVAGVIATV